MNAKAKMDFLQLTPMSPERKLEMYLACLAEFEALNYDDPYVTEIRLEVEKLKLAQLD